MKDKHGELHTDPCGIAPCLSEHWQEVFNEKQTDKRLRQRWMRHVRDRFKTSVSDLRPSEQDVDTILESLPSSASGPDGIPFAVYGKLKSIIAGPCKKSLTLSLTAQMEPQGISIGHSWYASANPLRRTALRALQFTPRATQGPSLWWMPRTEYSRPPCV